MEQVDPGDLQVPDSDWFELELEEINQTEVHMASGKVHRVLSVLRHPERDWAYAQRVTRATDEMVESNDIVLQADQIESVESDRVASSSNEDVPSDHWLIHYSCNIESTYFDNLWKTAANLHMPE